MIRDTFFSAPRFVNLCRKEMVESWKANLLRFVMMYGIMAIAFVWNGYFRYNYLSASSWTDQDPIWNFELGAFVWALVIMGLLSASFIMERMKTKTNRIAMLMIPATMFEKFFLTLAGIHFRFPYRISNSFQTGGLDTCNNLYD